MYLFVFYLETPSDGEFYTLTLSQDAAWELAVVQAEGRWAPCCACGTGARSKHFKCLGQTGDWD